MLLELIMVNIKYCKIVHDVISITAHLHGGPDMNLNTKSLVCKEF